MKNKEQKLIDKMVYETFYLEKQYQKIAKQKLCSGVEKTKQMADLFYFYFDKAFEVEIDNRARQLKYLKMRSEEFDISENEYILNEKNEIVLFKLLEIAPYFADCHLDEKAYANLDENVKNLYNLAIKVGLKPDDKITFAEFDKKVLSKRKLERERE